jgi:hypothetical protein
MQYVRCSSMKPVRTDVRLSIQVPDVCDASKFRETERCNIKRFYMYKNGKKNIKPFSLHLTNQKPAHRCLTLLLEKTPSSCKIYYFLRNVT